jgi:hypothetical protein
MIGLASLLHQSKRRSSIVTKLKEQYDDFRNHRQHTPGPVL